MVIRKVCLVGEPGAGKTSLIQAWVGPDAVPMASPHPDVRVHRKVARAQGSEVSLVLIDLSRRAAGETYPPEFLRGCAGYVLVVDASRPPSTDSALWLRTRIEAASGALPFVVAANKQDLVSGGAYDSGALVPLAGDPEWVVPTSARTGEGVPTVFDRLALRILRPAAPLLRARLV
ncbi:MAG: GTPase domain-containing protein [Gemmatimonadota bacterium]